MTFIAPDVGLNAFTCPHCGAFAKQDHFSSRENLTGKWADESKNSIRTTICHHCQKYCIWHFSDLVYPPVSGAPAPHSEMPESVKNIYSESANIFEKSPRAAAALLRLAIQLLCKELGGKGGNINEDIGSLVENGLPNRIQQSLDSVRVIGNNAVHPGVIDVDDKTIVLTLFSLTNLIVDYMISKPKEVERIYSQLPDNVKKQIVARDKQ